MTTKLHCCLRSYPFTDAIKSGEITVPGFELEFEEVKPHIGAFRRMVRGLEFDVCEIAPTTYMIARAHGVPIVALPIFFVRRFHHAGMLVRDDAGIAGPKDLEGKRIGVRAWSVTTGVWKRGLWQNEHGVDISKINWFVDDEEHVEALRLPDFVEHVPEGQSLAGMFAAGELDAGTAGDSGLGRSGNPTGGWSQVDTAATTALHELFPDPDPLDRAFYGRTGIFPMHGTLAIRAELLEQHPGLAPALFEAFKAAKQPYIDAVMAGTAEGKNAKADMALAEWLGDPLPYGLEENRKSIEGLITYAHQQGLIPEKVAPEDMFLPL